MERYQIALGIGDILLLAGWFKSRNINAKLIISHDIIRKYRNGSKAYLNFIVKLIETYLPQCTIEHNTTNNPHSHPVTISDFLGMEPLLWRDLNLDLDPSGLAQHPFVVIFTKCRMDSSSNRSHFTADLPLLLESIKSLRGRVPIILLGERDVSLNYENAHHQVQSFYSLLTGEGVTDLTEAELGNTPDWIIFQRDLGFIKTARAVIGFGVGGNLCMALTFAQKVIFYTPVNEYKVLSAVAGDENGSGKLLLTMDVEKFGEAVGAL